MTTSPYTLASNAARAKRKGEPIYPRLMVLGGTWVRQEYPGAPYEVLHTSDAERLLLSDEGAA